MELVIGPDIAKRIDATVKFLEQVLRDLKKGGVRESRRGNKAAQEELDYTI